MRALALKCAMVACLMLALAGCKHSTTPASTPSTNSSVSTAPSSAPSATCVIPQNNGGDHDADNNGGPDDGDGCDK
jgi:hypothetical protein